MIEWLSTLGLAASLVALIRLRLRLRRLSDARDQDAMLRAQAESALLRERAFLRALLDHLPVGVAAKRVDDDELGGYLFVNPACREIFGLRDEPTGRRLEDVFPREMADRLGAMDLRALREDRPARQRSFPIDRHGERRYLDVSKRPVRGADGKLLCVLSVTEDVTAQEAVRHRLRLADQVLEQIADAVLVTDDDEDVVMANTAFYRLADLTPDDVVGWPVHQCGLLPLEALFDAGTAVLPWEGESIQYLKDGSELPCWMTVNRLQTAPGSTLTIRVWSDITPLKQAQARLETLALFDTLTGLPNRANFNARLGHAVDRARRAGTMFAVMFIDLDDFKTVNDTLGHDAGDELLRVVAQRLQAAVRESDTVSRLGGDEFTVVAEELRSAEDVLPVCRRVTQALWQPATIAGRTVEVSGSVGVCLYPGDGTDAIALLKCADRAMYRVKAEGKRGWRFFSELEVAPPAPDAVHALDCLVADDMQVNRLALANMLRALGCTVREAADGEQAQAMMDERLPALAFLDHDMPGVTGLELARRLNRLEPARRPYVALYTGADWITMDDARAVGAHTVVHKPLVREKLVEVLAAAGAAQG